MKQSRKITGVVAVILPLVLMTKKPAPGQDESVDDQYVVKIYRVADLVLPTPNYAFNGVKIPGVGPGPAPRTSRPGLMGGMGGQYGTMSGFGGMGMGGGMFAVADGSGQTGAANGQGGGMGGGMITPPAAKAQADPHTLRFTMDDLIEAITTSVQPNSWDEVGGDGSIYDLGGMLVVSQTKRTHVEVAQLLDDLRQEGGIIRSVTVRANWLLLDAEQTRQLRVAVDPQRQTVNREALEQLSGDSGARGQITCFDGQTVYIVSGHIKGSVDSLIPVVGQSQPELSEQLAFGHPWNVRRKRAGGLLRNPHGSVSPGPPKNTLPPVSTPAAALAAGGSRDGQPDAARTGAKQSETTATDGPSARSRHYLAQVSDGDTAQVYRSGWLGRRSAVGYQPVVGSVNYGVLLQVTPTLVPRSEFVVLDLQSTVTMPSQEANQTVEYDGMMTLDRLNLVSHQFMTTLHLPLGVPTLVGGATLRPMSQDASQLYLVIEATVAKESK